MSTTIIYPAPIFGTVRSEAGAIAADNATINDTNYPLTKAFQPNGCPPTLLVWWTGTGLTPASDTLDLQVLLRDSKHSTPAWVQGATVSSLKTGVIGTFNIYGCELCYVRVVAKSTSGSALIIRAAVSQYAL